MFFGSPFIRNNLIQAPCEDKVKEDIEEEVGEGITDVIAVKGRKERMYCTMMERRDIMTFF